MLSVLSRQHVIIAASAIYVHVDSRTDARIPGVRQYLTRPQARIVIVTQHQQLMPALVAAAD